MTFRVRFFRLKHYLYIYNTVLRYARKSEHIQSVTHWLNVQWDTFSDAERQFVLTRELW